MITVEELLKKAEKPTADAMRLHPFYKGKYQTIPKCIIRDFDDFAIWYTPGVAAPCKDIQANPEKSYEHTNRGNTIAVISNGTRVLGLGDIGPAAGMPVMEGKSLLYKYLGGVDAVPLCIDEKDPDKLIAIVKSLEPSFGGINLEDIRQPDCFKVLDTLRAEMNIPVWHDDQQGTATIILAAVLNALKVVDKKLDEAKIVIFGVGAANFAAYRLLKAAGVNPGNIIACDSKGTLHPGRTDIEAQKESFYGKWAICNESNSEGCIGTLTDALKGADVLIAAAKSGPGVITKEQISLMAKDSIVFTCANPVPEMWPWEAKEGGARIVGTGRSDFANQVNNSVAFPGIFRGVLDVRAKTISDTMAVTAAKAIAKVAEDKGLDDEHIVPTMRDTEVFAHVAASVAMKAQEEGLALLSCTYEEEFKRAQEIIAHSRGMTEFLQKEGFVPQPPQE